MTITLARKKRKRLTTLGLTRKLYRGLGYRVGEVERHFGGRTYDLFGFIDLVAIRPDRTGVLGLQPTAWSKVRAHVRKILLLGAAQDWLKAGNRIAVIGWKRGNERQLHRWIEWIKLEQFEQLPPGACCEWKARWKGGRKRKAVVNQDVCLFG